MGRVYPNPKTRRVLDVFPEPDWTRTRKNLKFPNPKKPEPEVQTRGYPKALILLQNTAKMDNFHKQYHWPQWNVFIFHI